ncbi:MAG: hypothetical protein GX322_03350 [Firmicutes bacterium]|nr:hypothetical protein [Bacillota bacterium]
MSVSRETHIPSEAGQAILEYALAMSLIALPLIVAMGGVREQMAVFIRRVVYTVAMWQIGP